MSDEALLIVPRDASHVPSLDAQHALVAALRRFAPNAEEVTHETFNRPAFFDAGENFERVSCPSCAAEVDLGWWQDRMSEDWRDDGFELAKYALPCCGTQATLNELVYDWPQAFGRFCCRATNPGIADLPAEQKAELERIAGMPIVVVKGRI